MLWFPHIARSADSPLSIYTQVSTTKATLLNIQFQSVQNGWAVGSGGTILRTIDGGKKWKRVTSGTSSLLTSVFFVDPLNGWVAGAAGLLKRTTDGGNSWSSQS
ncbi:MAG: YCF48-related protein, partial [Nitrospira sp.]|nr:YCF48-related protein [Nitrospira sp.]